MAASTLEALDEVFGFSNSGNFEVLSAPHRVAVAVAEWE